MSQDAEILEFPVKLGRLDCPQCGVVFALPENLFRRRVNDGGSFFCPNGHALGMTPTAPVVPEEKLKQQVEMLSRALEQISKMQVGVLFNRESLDLAKTIASNSLEKMK